MSASQLNVPPASHNAKQLPVAASAGRQQATVHRKADDKRVKTEMGDLLGRAGNTLGAHNFNTLQQELRRQRNAYGKDHIAELVWRTAVYDTDFRMLKAIVMPGGIWQEAIHGCWTQLELPMALLHAFKLNSKSLLHEAIVHAGKENMSEVVELIVAKNSSILSFRDAFCDDMNPSELAITRRVPHSIVLSLSPKSVASLWEMDTPKGDPNPLRCVLQTLKKPGVTWKPVALSYYQTLRDQLQTRRSEVIEAKEAAKAAQELKKKKKQFQQQKQRQREENLRLAKLVLDNLPEILTCSEWEKENQQDFEIKMAVLLTEDNIEALISNPQLAMSYNRRLCEGVLLAANKYKAAAIPGLINVLRSITWEKLSCSNQLQPPRIQLLENSIDQGHTAGVKIMLEMHAYLLGNCAKPPLCVAVQKQHPLKLVNMLILPSKKYRPKGLEELDKECSALGYAMQAGQPELVKAIIPWTRMDHKFYLTLPDHDSKTADDGAKGAKQSRGKAQKASTSTSIYPLMYALELGQPSWLTSICSAAKAFFLLSADKVDCTQLGVSYTDAAKGRVFSPEAEKACTEAMSQWVDTSTGANNPPTALYRAIELEQAHAAEILLAAHANALKTIFKDEEETTPLHKAIDMCNIKFVKRFAELWQDGVKAKRVVAAALDTACNNVTPLLRAVQSQKFAIAELLVHAGADPLHTCKPVDKPNAKPCSPAPLTAVMDHIPAGDQKVQRAGLSLITLMISKAAQIRAQLKGGKAKAELHASEKQLVAEAGPALMYQAASKSLLKIGAHLSRLNIDVTEVPADGVSDARSASPLLLLIEAAQEPRKGYNAAVAEGNLPTVTVSSTTKREAAEQMLQNVLNSWTISKTAKAAHPSMLPQDQQKILDWLFAHKQVTINKFTKGKAEQRLLVQQTIDANSLGLLRLLVEHVKLSCSNCFLHSIVADAPFELLVVLMKAAGGLDTAHPELKSPLIHKAVEAGRMDVLQKLIGFGVMLKAWDALGNTPLHVAVKFKDEAVRHQMTVLLLTHAPTLSKEINKKGQKPVDVISHKKKLRDWFEAVEREVRLSQKSDAEKEHDELAESVKSSSDDEGEEGDGLLLTRADESIEKRKRRINQLLQEMPAVLKAAEEKEAHAAAKVKASQAELPSPQKAKPGAEFDGVKSALMDHLPADLPTKDELAPLQPVAAPAEEVAAPMSEEQLVDSLIGLPWEFIINKDARQEWARMDRPFRLMVIKRLQRIGEGQWDMDGGTEQRLSEVRGLEVYRTLLTRGGRIVFEVAVDYSQTAHTWKEMLRLWVITLDHEKYVRELNNIAQGHSKSVQARDNMKLRAMGTADAAKCDLSTRLPKVYEALREETGSNADGQEERPRAEPLTDVELREHFPAASSSQDTYTLLKFYNLSKDLVKTVLQDMNDAEVDFPFRVSPSEQYIIENDPDPPSSIVLVGRSGTGKTTCAVFRMWARWLTFHHHSTEPFHQIFLTANPKLRSEVAKQFHRLRAAILRDSEESKRLEELSKQDYSSLKDIPSDAFPLFWTTKQYLRAVDATLPEAPLGAGPFFPRLDGGALKYAEHAHNEEMGGIESMIDLDPGFAEDEEYESNDEQLEKGHSVNGNQEADTPTEKKGGLGPKLEADYDFFVDVMWANISTKEEKQTMTPALVYQEICSFLKGSSEAMDSPGGRLTLQGYLDVGRKRAPNFSADTRREVYPIFERYEREKLRLNRYDHMDLLFHIYQSLKTNGYQGVPIHNITRDEVQDFTQAELLVDLRTMCDANGLFCCGDPCQTIARGIVFRFADICTLFHHESQRRKDAGGIAAATIVGVPKKPLHLPTNYRTHSGILNAAAAVVDVLRQYFPMHIDNLAREKAFFKGPPPLLLSSLSPDDLTFLLLGSDPKTSQVEFGAHQVILGRTADSLDSLPQHLLDSNVIKMTVAQAKGLEFDDVFLWDFFNGSPAEWRPLNNYAAHLAEVEETQGARKLPAGTPLVDVEVDPIDKGALRVARSADQHDVLLCEELKYLYTALTRAKNNVIIFDSNTAKRAPFFNYLRRLGMAQYVSRSVMEDHTDDSRYVLTQGKNSSQDWVARGHNFMDNRLYDLAAHCFKVAEDAVRFTVATAFGKYLALKSKKSSVTPTESMQETFKIGHDLLTAAGRADEATSAVKLTERKNWLNIAAKLFKTTSEGKHIAARLFRELGNFKAAVAISTHLNDFAAAAETCEEEAHMLAAREPARAEKKLQEAIRHHKKAKQHLQGFQLLQRHPTLFKNMPPEKVDELAEIAMTAAHQQGQHEKAIEAARLIRSASRREAKLRIHGYWKELSEQIQDNSMAAKMLAEHGEMEAAIKRLMRPVDEAAAQGVRPSPTWAVEATLNQLYTYSMSLPSDEASLLITKVVDSYDDGQDPFKGDGYIAKGRVLSKLLGKQPDVTREIVIEQFLKAMKAYRCIAALAACMELYSEEELDFQWPAKNKLTVADGPDNGAPNYLSWTQEYGRAAQVRMEALAAWGLHSKADIHREALLDLEDYFAVKGLLSGSDKVSYKQHNNIICEAVKELDDQYHFLPGLADQHILQSGMSASGTVNAHLQQSNVTVELARDVAEAAVAKVLMQMVLPVLLKMSKAAVRKTLQDKQAKTARSLAVSASSVQDAINHIGQAMQLVELTSKMHRACQQFTKTIINSAELGIKPADFQQMRLILCANIAQQLLQFSPVTDLHQKLTRPFRQVTAVAGFRLNGERGQNALPDVALDMLTQAVVEKGEGPAVIRLQNRNAGFVAWFCLPVLLQNMNQFRRAAAELTVSKSVRKMPKDSLLNINKMYKLDFDLLKQASQAFASDRPQYACHALLFFMERAAVLDVKPDQEPSHALPLEAYLHLIETVSAVTLLSLGAITFLPDLYLDCLEWSPLMGQAGSRGRVNQEGRRVAALKRLQYKSDGVPSSLKLLTRAVRLLHHLMKTIVADKTTFQSRSLLVMSIGPIPGKVGVSDQEACQEGAAARMAMLAVTLLNAFAINASPDTDVKELFRATWRVVHMAEGCIQDASVLEALQLCRQAAKVGDMLPALQQVSYRLSSGLTEVSVDRQVPFDRLPASAPGLKTADPEVRALLALANATCIPYTADKLKGPTGDVRKLLLMPDEKEVASFTASTDTGAKLAAAALFIQEEWRAYRHRQLVAAKIRWLRASRLWREKFHSWTLSIRAKKRLQKEAEAVAALEERRKQYQANAQQRLAWVEEGLSQRLIEDTTCPVCRSDAGKKAAAAKRAAERRLAEGSDAEDEDEEDEDDEEQSGNNPFAALAGLQKAANAAPFVPHTQREYHEASLTAFQAYKHFYTDQVVPLLAEQKDVEAALQKMEPKAAQDAEVANKLHGQRFRLQECVTKVQECMNSLEKEHAWEDHTTHLASLLDHMRTLVQETNRWLQADEAKEVVPDSSVQADTPQTHVRASRGDAKPDATQGSPAKEQATDVLEHSWDEEEDDILGEDDFTLVVKKKKKKGAGKGPARRRL